jgi:cysteine-rich repeat protein
MTRKGIHLPFLALAVAALGMSACAGPSDESLGENQQNLEPCEYGTQCSNEATCHYEDDENNGLLTCNDTNPLNKYYESSCALGNYCDNLDFLYAPACEATPGTWLRCEQATHKLVAAECGDNVVTPEAGEVCDDGNTDQCAGGCNEDCTVAITGCQDGVVCGTEACDDGDAVNNDGCDANCTIPGCGNGEVAPAEECDDGITCSDGTPCSSDAECVGIGDQLCIVHNGDGCDNNCTVSGCMNGTQGPDEQCDDGNDDNGDGCDNNCTPDECGNGIVIIGEQCDDGNSIDGDGCQSNCDFPRCGDEIVDLGEECDLGTFNDNNGMCSTLCNSATCGDGLVQTGVEECDDGNAAFDDDCNPDCVLPDCGDGRQDANEACDDGNNTPGDGCSSVCTLEESCVDLGEDPECVPDGYGCRVQGEECSYDPDGAGPEAPYQLECLCPNNADEGKGSWEPVGSNCDDVDLCWVPGGVPSLSETCPGDPYTLTAGDPPLVFNGTTIGAEDNLTTCYSSDPNFDGGERVYHVTFTTGGTMKFNVIEEGDFLANLVIQTTCGSNTGSYCNQASFFPEGNRQIWANMVAGEYYFIVDSSGELAGGYEATIALTEPACGDGVLNPGENCDAGGAAPNDGCIDPGEPGECTYEAPDANADVCPGEVLNVPAGVTNLSSEDYTTNGYTNDYQPQGPGCFYGGPTGADRVFQLMPQATGTLTVTIGLDDTGETMVCQSAPNSAECWDYSLYARTDCATAGSQLACADVTGVNDGETISFPVTNGEEVFLFIDGFNGQWYGQGPFNLKLDLQP